MLTYFAWNCAHSNSIELHTLFMWKHTVTQLSGEGKWTLRNLEFNSAGTS